MEDKKIKVDVWFELVEPSGFTRETFVVVETSDKEFTKHVPTGETVFDDIDDCEWKRELRKFACELLRRSNEHVNMSKYTISTVEYSEDNEEDEDEI